MYIHSHTIKCFRPLSGFFLFLQNNDCNRASVQWFPSPIGVLLISTLDGINADIETRKFPSPIGVLLISTDKKSLVFNTDKFPSPIGVLLISTSKEEYNYKRKAVSVPYRGSSYFYEILLWEELIQTIVSVPYRGSSYFYYKN